MPNAFADDLIGQASVIDGDTIEIHGNRIRIFGIDAPESDQLCRNEESELYHCGQKASNALFDFSLVVPLNALMLIATDTIARWQCAPLGARTSLIGLSEMD
jgi:endonuclease YncB( thermonuclease family)